LLKALGGVLGLLQQPPQQYLQYPAHLQDGQYSVEEIENMIQQRLQARKERNFAQADTLRQQLAEAGIILEDSPQGTTWRRE